MQMLSIDQIKLDERCQPRASINPEIIDEYADAMTQGAEFPPLTVYRDGTTYFLADGFHRIAAANHIGQAHVVCDVKEGTIRDAILHAVGANATHGQRRTNLDKRRAVETLLRDKEWSKWTDNSIAKQCGVSNHLVDTMRAQLGIIQVSDERTYTDRYGNQRVMNTANIGRPTTLDLTDQDFIDFDDEDIDQDTGEIRNAPSRSFFDNEATYPPKKQQPRGQLDTLEFMDYGADDPELTYKSIAYALIHDYGNTAALRVAAFIKEGAK